MLEGTVNLNTLLSILVAEELFLQAKSTHRIIASAILLSILVAEELFLQGGNLKIKLRKLF